MPRPVRVFIGSSSEGLSVAHHLQAVLEERGICEVDCWDQDVFEPSRYALESLLEAAQRVDFAVLVASPDDVTVSRGTEVASVRDNIILEYGLFTGALGRERTYLLATGDPDTKLPTDTLGLTRLPFRPRTDGNLRAAVNDAVLKIQRQVEKRGPRASVSLAPNASIQQAALNFELELLCANAVAQGWTVKTNSPTTLRLRSPRGKVLTFSKRQAAATRNDLRGFVAELRAAGVRVNSSIRRPADESPL